MSRRRYWAVLLGLCVCVSMTACGKNKEDIFDKYEGVTEGEGGLDASLINQKDEEKELNYETVGGGVSVFVAEDVYEDITLYEESDTWYPNEDVFLEDYGFRNSEPFYEYIGADGRKLMKLYYNAESGIGCGVRYSAQATETFPDGDGRFGFVFRNVDKKEWTGFNVEDYMALTSVYGGNGSQAVTDYEEIVEYDEAEQITLFEARGIVPELVEQGYADPIDILHMEFDYYEEGGLKSRKYNHSHYVFPTALSSLRTYFDEMERPVYENGYISHGEVEYYYIYEDKSRIPKYCLTLDFMHESWMPVFEEYVWEEMGETTNAIHFD